MPTLRQRLDTVFLGYFISHIPITIAVDVLPLLPTEIIPQPLLSLNRFLTTTIGDPFMVIDRTRTDLVWFRSLLTCELFVQLPFFFYAVWMLWTGSSRRHLWLLMYGVHVSTTMAPVLGMLMFGDINRSCDERMALGAMYLPYLLIPLAMAAVSFTECSRMLGFTADKRKKD
ncbi:Transmembrane protein 97 [Coemansia sp. RSA 678]|nr:Transmembrane protein 97 [Coemansia sp. RSA 678]